MAISTTTFPQLVETQEPLGLFFRPGHNDHRIMCQLLSEGRSALTGVVFNPCFMDTHGELFVEVQNRNLEALIDPQMMELATPNGFTRRRAELPWAGKRPHEPSDFSREACAIIVKSIVDFVLQHGATAVLAPTHYLRHGFRDIWFQIDRDLTRQLRDALDARDATDVAIYYPLALPTRIFFDSAQRTALRATLQALPIDGIWLRIHPFGSQSGHVTLQRYILACRDFHGYRLPLIAEKTGNIGLALLAFGAVSGLDAGVSSGEKFDFSRLVHKSQEGSARGFAPHQRVYISPLGVFLMPNQAQEFFQNRSFRALFACSDTGCCRRGAKDMISNPRRHFVISRIEEVGLIGRVPHAVRATEYLERILRPATDKLGRALQIDPDSLTRKRLEKERLKLDGWRNTLGEMSRSRRPVTFAVPPTRRALRQRRGA